VMSIFINETNGVCSPNKRGASKSALSLFCRSFPHCHNFMKHVQLVLFKRGDDLAREGSILDGVSRMRRSGAPTLR